MSQVPPPSPSAYSMPGPRTSGMAIASLICGILLCIPVIAPLLAIIFGIVGLGQTRRPNVSGRGLAIAGLILGIIGLVGQIGVAGSAYWGVKKVFQMAAPHRLAAESFMQNLSQGDVAAAGTQSSLSQNELSALADKTKNWGSFQNLSLSGVKFEGGQAQLAGTATFSQGAHPFKATVGLANGTYRIISFTFE